MVVHLLPEKFLVEEKDEHPHTNAQVPSRTIAYNGTERLLLCVFQSRVVPGKD